MEEVGLFGQFEPSQKSFVPLQNIALYPPLGEDKLRRGRCGYNLYTTPLI